MESMALVVTAKKVLKAKIVNTDPVLQNCVNMVVLAKTKQMVIIAIVLQAGDFELYLCLLVLTNYQIH